MKERNQLIIFTTLFIFLNAIGTFFYSLQELNNYIITFAYSPFEVIFSSLGNVIILSLISLIIFLFFKKTKSRMTAMTILSFIFSLIGLSLWVYTRFYQSPFLSRDLTFAKNAENEMAFSFVYLIPSFLFVSWRIVLFINFFVLLIVQITFTRINKKRARNNIYGRMSKSKGWLQKPLPLLVGIILLSALSFGHIKFGYNYVKSKWKLNHESSLYGIQTTGLYNFYLYDILGFSWTEQEDSVKAVASDMERYDKNVASYTNFFGETYSNRLSLDDASTVILSPSLGEVDSLHGIFKDKNVVYIQLETFNSYLVDGTSSLIESLNLMPNWHKLVNESYYFENFYATVGLGNSSDAEITGMTGLYPVGNRLNFWQFGNSEYYHKVSLYEKLLNSPYAKPIDFKLNPLPVVLDNYYSASYHGDNRFFYNRENVHPGMFKFDEYFHYSRKDGEPMAGVVNATDAFPNNLERLPGSPWVGEKDLFEWVKIKAKEKQAAGEKYFMYPITIHAHTPFFYNPYIDEPAFTKDMLKVTTSTLDFLNYLKFYNDIFGYILDMANELTDTIYVLYTDHGAAISPNEIRTIAEDPDLSPIEVWRKLSQVPALIYAPDDNSTGEVKEGLIKGVQPKVRSQVDLYRTLLELIDKSDTNFYYGVNGLSDEKTFAFLTRTSMIITDDFSVQLKQYIPNKKIDEKSIYFYNDITYDLDKFISNIVDFKYYNDLMISNNLLQEINRKKKGH